MSFKDFQKTKDNSCVYKNTKEKPRICSMRAVGYVKDVKDSFERDSKQRPKDINYVSTVLRSTSWAIEGTHINWMFKTLFNAKPGVNLKEIY